MFELTAAPIDATALSARLSRPEAGALAVFEGRVRNHHLGAPVTHLEYEAFDELAIAEGAAIVEETQRLYPGVTVLCVHRTGALRIGETALWIGVASAHRQAGFAACRQVIEEIKRRLPIWKKEHHPGGAAEWVNCTAEAAARIDEDYHSRQRALPEVGATGQARLTAAHVLIVGLGGLGCPAALYLTGAGIGRLTLVDRGRIELSNLHRQVLFAAHDIGASKALVAAARLRAQSPTIEITVHDTEFSVRNARALVAGHDVVLDGTNNFSTRFLMHDACLALGVPLVSAAVHRFEGTLDVFRRGAGGCLHDQWPGRAAGEFDAAGNCAGAPVFAPAAGVLGVMQAAEALKILLGIEGEAAQRTQLVNLLDGTFQTIARPSALTVPSAGSSSW
ncbi:MAG: ThiF family adenylyltransferase [Opitutae bacterium]|nr:ThiF family adenylyltransferase [Opitutae bacterium]